MVYKCELCGKEYDSIDAAQACEEACLNTKKQETLTKEQAELELKKEEDELGLLFKKVAQARLKMEEAQRDFDIRKYELRKKYPGYICSYDSHTNENNELEVDFKLIPNKEYNNFKDFYNTISKFIGEKDFSHFLNLNF